MLSLGQASVSAGRMEMHSDRRMIFLSSLLVFSLEPLTEPPPAPEPPPEDESKNSRRAMPFWLAGYRTNQFFFHFWAEKPKVHFKRAENGMKCGIA